MLKYLLSKQITSPLFNRDLSRELMSDEGRDQDGRPALPGAAVGRHWGRGGITMGLQFGYTGAVVGYTGAAVGLHWGCGGAALGLWWDYDGDAVVLH